MEALGAASSVAGLLSLTRQCISGLQKLRELYQDIATALKTLDAFLKDTDSLLRSLHDVRVLLEKIDAQPEPFVDDVSTASLKIQLEECNLSICEWLRTAFSSKPSSGKGGRAWFRKFWLAVNKESVSNIRSEMQRRRTELVLALATLGRYIIRYHYYRA